MSIEIPREENNTLYLADAGVKTTWYDREEGITYDNEDLLPLYNKIASRLKRKFKFPACAYNIKNPTSIRIYRGVGFTKAVKEFAQNGGELMQSGVNNVRFIIREENEIKNQ